MPSTGSSPDEVPDARYRTLPTAVRLEDTVAIHEVEAAPDPDGGQDPERDFMLRYAG